MPVTAKLSKKFYETLGEDVTNELVEWFNSVDTTYRTGLRELNETNFTRFDARLGERLAAVDARFTALDAKLEQRLAELRGDLRAEVAQLETRLTDRLDQVKSDLLKWMLTFWVSTLIGLGALFFRG